MSRWACTKCTYQENVDDMCELCGSLQMEAAASPVVLKSESSTKVKASVTEKRKRSMVENGWADQIYDPRAAPHNEDYDEIDYEIMYLQRKRRRRKKIIPAEEEEEEEWKEKPMVKQGEDKKKTEPSTSASSSETKKKQQVAIWEEKEDRWPRGLIREGNWCYALAVLQLIVNMPLARRVLAPPGPTDPVSVVLEAFRQIGTASTDSCFNPRDLTWRMRRVMCTDTVSHQDADEMFVILMESLDNEQVPQLKQLGSVTKITTRSILYCPDCHATSYKDEESVCLPIHLPEHPASDGKIIIKSKPSPPADGKEVKAVLGKLEEFTAWPPGLMELVVAFAAECGVEKLLSESYGVNISENGSLCSNCPGRRRTQHMYLKDLGEEVVIRLCRSTWRSRVQKRTDVVTFPFVIDFSPWMIKDPVGSSPTRYECRGVVEHWGQGALSGHWVTYVRNPIPIWYCANDDHVYRMKSQDIPPHQWVLLHYTRCKPT